MRLIVGGDVYRVVYMLLIAPGENLSGTDQETQAGGRPVLNPGAANGLQRKTFFITFRRMR